VDQSSNGRGLELRKDSRPGFSRRSSVKGISAGWDIFQYSYSVGPPKIGGRESVGGGPLTRHK
jgi:hypothetical protein